MYLTCNEDKSVIAERFIRTLWDSCSYLNYSDKLVDKYNNTYFRFICKIPIDANYSALTEAIEINPKAPKFKVGNRVRITKYKNIFIKSCINKWVKNIFAVNSVMRTSSLMYTIKD